MPEIHHIKINVGAVLPNPRRACAGMRAVLAVCGLLLLAACASSGPYQLDLMPAPQVYSQGNVDPFEDRNPIEDIPYQGILYATDREPADEAHPEQLYQNKRGHMLRLGVGQVTLGREGITWEEARQISLAKNRTESYPLRVNSVTDFGILENTVPWSFYNRDEIPDDVLDGDEEFIKAINEKLAVSKRKHIYIYTHGYKVVFENPLLVATELWHFLGYDGAFVAYAWASTPRRLAYFADLETANLSARNLRKFIEYLAHNTTAEKIHIVGYSAGTRVVAEALSQLALQRAHMTRDEILAELRLGQVMLVGSDIDRDLFGAYIEDGILNVSDKTSVYLSKIDKALGVSKWLFERARLGQLETGFQMRPEMARFLGEQTTIDIIDVSAAEKSNAGNGHSYFRQSPWASSDLLMTLLYGLGPQERGLERTEEIPVWSFPPDYVERLIQAIRTTNPDLGIP
jgi:esterase/lipase superfamily enzyme